MIELLRKLEQRLLVRIANVFRRGELGLCNNQYGAQIFGYAGDEEGDDQEQLDSAELWQQYGIASRPPAGAEVLCACLMGASENAIPFATNSHDDRPIDLAEGEVVTYGKKVAAGQAQARHKPDGTLALACATGKFVEVGGNTDKLIRGDAFVAAFTPMAAATDPASTMSLVNAILAALKVTPLATKGKVA